MSGLIFLLSNKILFVVWHDDQTDQVPKTIILKLKIYMVVKEI